MKHFILHLFSIIFIPALSVYADVSQVIPDKKGNLEKLPSGDIAAHFIPRFIDILMKVSYTLAVAAIVYAGILYIIADGDDGDIQKAKKIFIFGIIGFLVITISYGMVQGILRLEFFKN